MSSQNEETVPCAVIPLEIYEELMESAAFLEALQACGVDDWEGYDEAVEFFNEMSDKGTTH